MKREPIGIGNITHNEPISKCIETIITTSWLSDYIFQSQLDCCHPTQFTARSIHIASSYRGFSIPDPDLALVNFLKESGMTAEASRPKERRNHNTPLLDLNRLRQYQPNSIALVYSRTCPPPRSGSLTFPTLSDLRSFYGRGIHPKESRSCNLHLLLWKIKQRL
jgi:hypothetical protein